MHRSNTLKLLLIFIFITNYSFAQTDSKSGPAENLRELMRKGTKSREHGEYPQALEYFTKAEVLAGKKQLQDTLFIIKNEMGICYKQLSNFGESLGYYQAALQIAKKLNDKTKLAKVLTNIGTLYGDEKDYETALYYYKQAYPLANTKNTEFIRNVIAVNLSDAYNKLGRYNEARKYLEEVKALAKTSRTEQLWIINYAETYLLEGKLNEAQKMIEELLQRIDLQRKKDDGVCYTCMTELLSKIYAKQGKINLAISFAQKGLKNTHNLTERIELYGQISNLYIQKKEFITAIHYRDSATIAKDSLSESINRGLFTTNKMKIRVQEYQNDLKISKERQWAERIIFMLVAIFSLTLFYFIYRGLKNRITKQKQEKIIAENEKKILSLEFDNLKSSVAEKNRKLSAKALYLSGRNELIEEVIDSLSQIPEISKKKEVTDYIKTLKTYIKKDDEWDDFITYFEQVNPVFIKALTEKYPDLNAADIRYLCYVYMNLDLREIANIFNITYNAALKRQRRIKEKMNIDMDVALYEYLIQVF